MCMISRQHKIVTTDNSLMPVITATTSSGLRMACETRPGATVEYVALMVLAGSRDDPGDKPGLAHLVEHTIFKGTTKRRPSAIINTMERVGGELNAYTTKEVTAIYSAFPAGYARRAASLISDIVSDSQFPDAELEKEREVVVDEINSYLDIPAENIFDEFEDAAYAGTVLGHNILGTADSVRSITSADCREYLHRLYRAPNVVAVYSGPLCAPRALRILEDCFGTLNGAKAPRNDSPATAAPAFNLRRKLSLHQANVVMGAETSSIYDESRFAISLVVNMLGGPSMNSRLNVALREKRGLVYSVESWTNMYADTGLSAIYFGCDPEDVGRCMRIVKTEIKRLCDGNLTERALMMAKRQYAGQMTVGADNRESYVLAIARQLLYYGQVTPLEASADRIYALTADEVREAAGRLQSLSWLVME